MKRIAVLISILLTHGLAEAQERTIDFSRISNVTVFLSKAQVTREFRSRLDAGKTDFIVKGLTSQLDPQSIQVEGKGNFTILGIVHQQNHLSEVNMPRSLRNLRDSVEYLQRQIVIETSQKEILNKEEQMLLSNQKIGGANQNLTVAELRSMADFYRTRLSDIVMSRMKQDVLIKKLNERLVKVQRQLNEENELYLRNTSEIVISVSAPASTIVDVVVNYVVANAGWYPVYDLRATNTKSPVQLSYKANVFQSTGENWNGVKLKLSTANPSLGGVKPELYTWQLSLYHPLRFSKGKVAAVETKSAPSVADGYFSKEEVAAPAETTADYVRTIQTSLNTEFEIGLPYTIASSSKPTLVDIRQHEMKADYSYSAAPKLDADAFLMARSTGWEEFSLLPGEANIFFEGTFVGKSYIDPNNIRDTLSISLGRDKRIVVKREKLKDFSSRKLIGTNQRESFAYEISVRNTKNEPVKITIEDQVPVSQNSQIEVTVTEIGGAKYNKDTGKLSWDIALQPNETKKVVYKFEVKYPKDANVSGLN
jgi:uncharacterized protein (TIGR02231 family)